MTASALRDVKAKPSIATPIANKISEAMLPIMQYVGMQKLDVKIEGTANLNKVTSSAECFEKTPENMVAFAMLVKDSIAEILAASGITHLEIVAEKAEKEMLVDGYEQLDAMYKAALISSADSEEKTADVKLAENKPVQKKRCICNSKSCKIKKG